MVLNSLGVARTWLRVLEGRHQKPWGRGGRNSSTQFQVLTLFQTESKTPYEDMYMTLSRVPPPSCVLTHCHKRSLVPRLSPLPLLSEGEAGNMAIVN